MTADKDALLLARDELLNIGDTKRFNRQMFRDETEWADWAQSRARHTAARITAALAEKDDGWIKCSERMPKAGDRVFVLYSNANGLHRKTIAHYAPKHTISAEHWEEAETDDTEDGIRWEPEGWWEDYAEAEYITPLPDPVTHWRPLPPLPKGDK